jgi:hypothetical protein
MQGYCNDKEKGNPKEKFKTRLVIAYQSKHATILHWVPNFRWKGNRSLQKGKQ